VRVFGEQPTNRESQKRGNAPGIARPDTGRAERIATISGLDRWRIGVSSGGTIPNSDNNTLEREVRANLVYQRWMELARERGVVQGREMRIDTAVVETNIHYPTDSGLLGDGARVLTRTMKKVEKAAGD